MLFRAGLRLILERTPGFEVVGEAGKGATALALAQSTMPELVVADVHLPGEDGIQIIERILEVCPSGKILFLSSHAAAA